MRFFVNSLFSLKREEMDIQKAFFCSCSRIEGVGKIKLLIEKGADIEARNINGYNSLDIASCRGNTEVVKFLIEKGVNIEDRSITGGTPLLLASFNGKIEVVKYLIEKGSNIEARNNRGETPLTSAFGNQRMEVIKFLIKNGADVEAKNNYGVSFYYHLNEKNKMETDLIIKDVEERKRMIKPCKK